IERDDAAALVGEDGDRTLGELVAAAAQYADAAGARINEPAVEVAQLDPELALPEIVFLRRRAPELGQLQDRLVDRGERHIRFLARGEAGDFDPDLDGAPRPRHVGRGERHGERPRARIDAEPGDPNRPSGPP